MSEDFTDLRRADGTLKSPGKVGPLEFAYRMGLRAASAIRGVMRESEARDAALASQVQALAGAVEGLALKVAAMEKREHSHGDG